MHHILSDQALASRPRTAARPGPSAAGATVLPWTMVSEATRLALSCRAMAHAGDMIGDQAESLAIDIENGHVANRSGPEALRLLAALIRANGQAAAGGKPHA